MYGHTLLGKLYENSMSFQFYVFHAIVQVGGLHLTEMRSYFFCFLYVTSQVLFGTDLVTMQLGLSTAQQCLLPPTNVGR